MDGQGENDEDIAMDKLIKSLQKQVDKDNFQKKKLEDCFDYYCIVPQEMNKKEDLYQSSF